MWRKAAGVVLALSIGFFMYRAALVALPPEQYVGTSPPGGAICAGGTVSGPHFDAVTGLPAGWLRSCPDSDVQAFVADFSDETWEHWQRSALFGLAGGALALILLWWGARRRGQRVLMRTGR